MNPLQLFWLIVASASVLLLFLAFREAWLALRTPPSHHDRGISWFNAFFLGVSSFALLWGGYYLDGGRRDFEEIFVAYPESRYAIEENGITRNEVWVYVTEKPSSEVMHFYREYARAQGIMFLEDDGMRMSFTTPTGKLFLTIKEGGGKSRLYFSRDGRVEMAPNP